MGDGALELRWLGGRAMPDGEVASGACSVQREQTCGRHGAFGG